MVIDFLNSISKSSALTTSVREGNVNKEINEQYFTPISIASFMSSMLKPTNKKVINFMDAGAGIGNLTAAFIATVCSWNNKPQKIIATLYEIDDTLISHLKENMALCENLCRSNNIDLEIIINNEDFIVRSVENIINRQNSSSFDYIILNPPYKKMSSDSKYKKLTLDIGIDVPNYYAAFVALSNRFLNDKGQLVCIIPRSFCNGQYFKAFRNDLISNVKIERLHVFGSRKDLFEDDVLQETIIMYIIKKRQLLTDNIVITESMNDDFSDLKQIRKRFENVVFPSDTDNVIRIIKEDDNEIVEKMHSLPCVLQDININVSTGPVVDFRENPELLSYTGTLLSIPIIYPENFFQGFVQWPIDGKKPGYILEDESNQGRLRDSGIYVLVKRMSSKEESKRVVAAVYDSDRILRSRVAFDNKVNYYHISNAGLNNLNLAKGLSLYLNSSLVDNYFRTFSGSTQVNVGDLKSLKYPDKRTLELLGQAYEDILPKQEKIDEIVEQILFLQ